MASKRTRLTRSPDRRKHRKRVAPPTTGWLKVELAALARIAPTTIAKYVKSGLLTRAEFRGTATRYQREHLIRLLAIRHLRADGVVELTRIKSVFARMSAAQLEEWVLSRPNSPELVRALTASDPRNTSKEPTAAGTQAQSGGINPRGAIINPRSDGVEGVVTGTSEASEAQHTFTPRHSSGTTGPSATPPTNLGAAMLMAETWQCVHLAPGVALTWRADASPAAKELVQRLISSV